MIDEIALWWENMAGPRMLIEEMSKSLSDGKNVVLRLDGDLPWHSSMRDYLAHQLSAVQIKPAILRKGEKCEIVPQLLRQLSRTSLGDCPQDPKSQISYLRDRQIFQDCVIWLALEPDCDPFPVMQFLSDFRGRGLAENGCFVLEVPAHEALPRFSSCVTVLNCNDSVRTDDIHLFSSILADSHQALPESFRNYAAWLAACLAGKNGELVPAILQRLKAEEDPAALWTAMEQEGSFCAMPHRTPAELEQLIWQAQLQTVFADIEMERLRITAQWEELITAALHTAAWDFRKGELSTFRQFGEELRSAADVELGTLVYMMGLRRSDDHSQWLLYIPDEEEREWVYFLCECRNKLAHHTDCSPEEMLRLLARICPQGA